MDPETLQPAPADASNPDEDCGLRLVEDSFKLIAEPFEPHRAALEAELKSTRHLLDDLLRAHGFNPPLISITAEGLLGVRNPLIEKGKG